MTHVLLKHFYRCFSLVFNVGHNYVFFCGVELNNLLGIIRNLLVKSFKMDILFFQQCHFFLEVDAC